MPRHGNGFGGFPAEAFRFYEQLGAENTKAFWTQHKRDYDEYVKAPFETLAAAVATEFGLPGAAPPQRIGGFAADRRCWPPDATARFTSRARSAAEQPPRCGAAALGSFAADQLERYRLAVDSKAGNELDRLLGSYRRQHFEIGGSVLKSAPRGYPKDHPLVHLLRHKGVYVSKSFAVAKWVHTPKALDRIVTTWRATDLLHKWLNRNVGPSTQPPDDW
jgi:uncharacterized protein (DUF2461 family)